MLLDDDALHEIEDALVSATLRPETWPSVVAQIVDATGARGAAVLPLRGRVPGVPLSRSCEDLIGTYFGAGWSERDHRMAGIPRLMRTGLLVDQDISTPDFVRTSAYYNDFLGGLGFRWFAGLLVAVGGDVWCLTLQRTPAQGPFTPDEQAALRRMIAPLSRTARLAQSLGEARVRGIADALEALGVAGLLIDRTGRAIRVNAKAEGLLGGDLELYQGRLSVPGDRRTTEAIQAHIAAALWAELRPDDPALCPVLISTRSRRSLMVSAQPLRRAGLEYLDGARAILTVKDLSEAALPAGRVLKAAYGLTAREADLCEALLSGRSLAESADILSMNVSTARTHLKRIMAKTDTSRQGELLMLLGRYRRV